MALPAWQATIVTGEVTDGGDIIPSPVITVIVEATGQPAVLFSNRAGTTPLGNNGVFTGGVDGFAQFFAVPGEYRVTASDAGSGFSQTWDFVVLAGTMAVIDAQESPTDATLGRGVTTNALGENDGPIFTTGNLNPNVFGTGSVSQIATGSADSTTVIRFRFEVLFINKPGSFTVSGTGTVSVFDSSYNLIQSGVSAIASSAIGSNKVFILEVTTSGHANDAEYHLLTDGTTIITVNE